MKIKVLFRGILSEWMGAQQKEIDLPEEGVFFDLCQELRSLYGSKMPDQLWDEKGNNFNPAVWAMRGKERVIDPRARLREGEEIIFFLSMAGG